MRALRRLTSFPPMTPCVWFALNCALKARVMGVYKSLSKRFRSSCWITTVFLMPVVPEERTRRSLPISAIRRKAFLTVSTVCTMMVCTCASLGMSMFRIFFIQSSD